MARTTHQYAVRISVDGGGRVQAELRGVGDSGERSLKKIDRASGTASRSLVSLAERASSLRSGIRLLGGALAGITAAGGLAALINRSLETADAIGKTANKLGVGVGALQELRHAASLAGVQQNTLDMALQRFTRRVGEAARGTGEAKEALASMGIALRDQNGHIRRSDELLGDVADALRSVEDPAERLRLAFKLFDSEGVAMVNMLRDGADGLAATRQRARDLGLVLEEDLIRGAEKAKDELEILGKVISTNLTRAILDLSPLIEDLSSGLADLAADAGVAYEQLKLVSKGDYNFEGLSLRSTRRIVQERRQELKDIAAELEAIGEISFLDDPMAWARKQALESRLQERVEQYRQWAAKLSAMQAEADRKAPPTAAPDPTTTPDAIQADVELAEERARRIARIEQDLQRQLFEARHEGAGSIRAEFQRLEAELQTLIAPDGANRARIEQMIADAAAVRDARLAEQARRESETANRQREVDRKLIEGLRAERDELALTDRQRFVSQALRRLSASATELERRQVEELAGSLFDERQAIEARNEAEEDALKLREKGRSLTESLRTAEEAYRAELEELNALLAEGAISQETLGRASEDAYDRMLRASEEWSAGVIRALRDYGREAGDAARLFETITSSALRASEDAWVEWARTGKLSVTDFFSTLEEAALRAAYRLLIFKPMESLLSGLAGSISFDFFGSGSGSSGPAILDAPAYGSGGFAVAHTGGLIGTTPLPHRAVDPAVFASAPRFHGGGLVAGEVPIIAKRGEVVGWPQQMREAFGSDVVVQVVDQRSNGARPEVSSERGSDGKRLVRVLIRDEVNRGIAQGAFDQTMASTFGISRRGTVR